MEGASLGYGGCPVLSGVDLELREGELVGVLGPNGSGKTTLLRGATRVVDPMSGAVRVNDRPVGLYDRRELARTLAVVPQESAPLFAFTALETVLMGRAPWMTPFSFEGADDVRLAREALEAVEATHLAGRAMEALSGGERQRVIVARALAQGTRCLLADEPTAHLDLRHAVDLFRLLRQLRTERGLAVLVVTHDVNLAALFCDRLVLLADGVIAVEGTPDEVMRPDRLARAFGTPVHVENHPDGTPFVVHERGEDTSSKKERTEP
jgi:iron complex transport system ATP-binding protein